MPNSSLSSHTRGNNHNFKPHERNSDIPLEYNVSQVESSIFPFTQLLSLVGLLGKLPALLVAEKDNVNPSLQSEKYLRRLLWYLLGGTRGGANRAEILKVLHERPSNANQLAGTLGVDYKTVQHHLRVLEENGLVAPSEKGAYGAVLFLTPKAEDALPVLQEIWSKIGRTKISTVDKGGR